MEAADYRLVSTDISAALGVITPASLTAGLTGTVSKTYDTTDMATLVPANYTLTGMLGRDSVSLNDPVFGAYDTGDVGTGKIVSVTGLVLSGLNAGDYRLASTDVGGPVGLITALPPPNVNQDFSSEIATLVATRPCPALAAGSAAPAITSCGASALPRAPDLPTNDRKHLIISLPPEISLDGRQP